MLFQQRNLKTKIVLIVLLTIFWNEFYGQQKYSIDNGKLRKSGRVGIVYRVQKNKINKKDREELKTLRKEKRIVRKGKRKHMKKMQTKETQKQMKDLLRASKRINKHKPQYYMHERLYEKTSLGIEIFAIRLKNFIKNAFINIKSIFVSKTSSNKKKRNNFEIDKN